jgi:multiple sugar transport system permease protein
VATGTRDERFAGGAIPWWSWIRLQDDRNFLGFWFMLPAAAFLLLFLTYPLGLGIWLSFTDTKIGREGILIGLENFQWLADDSVFWLSVFNAFPYMTGAVKE